jgi:hypothetical protein
MKAKTEVRKGKSEFSFSFSQVRKRQSEPTFYQTEARKGKTEASLIKMSNCAFGNEKCY